VCCCFHGKTKRCVDESWPSGRQRAVLVAVRDATWVGWAELLKMVDCPLLFITLIHWASRDRSKLARPSPIRSRSLPATPRWLPAGQRLAPVRRDLWLGGGKLPSPSTRQTGHLPSQILTLTDKRSSEETVTVHPGSIREYKDRQIGWKTYSFKGFFKT